VAKQPKRLPGEPNPEAQPLELEDFVRGSGVAHGTGSYWMANGNRNGDFGIARGISALIDWRKRRKASQTHNSE
jgi:hypothetical protein